MAAFFLDCAPHQFWILYTMPLSILTEKHLNNLDLLSKIITLQFYKRTELTQVTSLKEKWNYDASILPAIEGEHS